MQRLLISAAHKSSGKTTLSLGICAALTARGITVQPFKKGPDYIDPMWLSRASARDCHNLDFQTMPDNEILATIEHFSTGADIAIIEGNKGLYDGVAVDGSNSNAAIAELSKTPVVLVIDTNGMTRGIAPLLLGYQAFNQDINIAGVILNKVGGPRHEQKLRAVIEEYTDIPVIGAVPRLEELAITERHLGLIPGNEVADARQTIDLIASHIEKYIDLELLLKIAASAEALPDTDYQIPEINRQADIRVGLAHDAAFGFYYPGDLHAFRVAGAELVEFDTLKDSALPEVDALFIGGGFPESWMKELEANHSLREQIRQVIEGGMPVYAECGGLMYLTRSISWKGQSAEMVGAIKADTIMNKKPQGRGYVSLSRSGDFPWSHADSHDTRLDIPAHEFHYSSLKQADLLENDPEIHFAYKMQRGHGITGHKDGLIYRNLLANYAHLRDTSRYHWVAEFVEFIRQAKG